MKKSQISLEFVFAIGIIFFIFLAIFGFVMDRRIDLRNSETEIDKRNTCLLISGLATSAFIVGDGVIVNVSSEYKANITELGPYYKRLEVEGAYCLLPIHTMPNAMLSDGVIIIENKNNYIDIENV